MCKSYEYVLISNLNIDFLSFLCYNINEQKAQGIWIDVCSIRRIFNEL